MRKERKITESEILRLAKEYRENGRFDSDEIESFVCELLGIDCMKLYEIIEG